MNAAVLDADDRLTVTTVEEAAPGPGQVAVRVAYAGIQWGDILVRQGHFPVPRPFVPGFEAAGEIVAIGEGVAPERLGQHVAALTQSGAFADVVLADDVLTFDVGDTDLRTAAGFGWVTPTAYALINEIGRVQPGDRVLIHAAAGGVGTLAAQFAAAAGAGRIVGVVLDGHQAAYAAKFPYDLVVEAEDFPSGLDDDEAFDVVLDPIGGDVRHANMARLAPHGRLVVYGNIATFAPVQLGVNDLLMQGQSLLTYNSNLLSQTDPLRLAVSAVAALAALEAGQARIDVTAECPLEELDAAITRLAEGRTHGKSIVRVG